MSDAMAIKGAAIHEVFKDTLDNISETIDGKGQDIVVDVEMHFKSIYVDKSSGLAKLLYSQKHAQETLEIRIATRIRSS
jgi:hypothetical protein